MRRPGPAICVLILYGLLVACGHRTSPRPAAETIPGEIGLISARAYPGEIVLRWSAPTSNTNGSPIVGLSGFKVYRTAMTSDEECEDCGKMNLHDNVDYQAPVKARIVDGEVTYTDDRVEPGYRYSYWVSAYNLKGREGPSGQEVTVDFERPPPAPRKLRAEFEDGVVTLEWQPPSIPAGIRTYRIYRGEENNAETMKPVGRTKWAETTFSDKGVERDKTYYYLVRSVKFKEGIPLESDPSRTVGAVIPPLSWEPPENINTAATRDGIRVFWNPRKIPGKEARYNIYRSEGDQAFIQLNTEPLRNPSFHDKKVEKGKSYRYAVTVFPKENPDEESKRSASKAMKFVP